MAAPTSEQELTQSPVSRHAFFNPMKKCICEKRWELLQAVPASDTVVAKATQRQATANTEGHVCPWFNREETNKLNDADCYFAGKRKDWMQKQVVTVQYTSKARQ